MMKARGIAGVVTVGWLLGTAALVSGACYQLTDLGSGCGYSAPVVAPECVFATTTNIGVSGSTGSGTGQGKTEVNCRMVTYCAQTIGTLSNGVCVAGQSPWTQTPSGLTCALSGTTCTMTINDD